MDPQRQWPVTVVARAVLSQGTSEPECGRLVWSLAVLVLLMERQNNLGGLSRAQFW